MGREEVVGRWTDSWVFASGGCERPFGCNACRLRHLLAIRAVRFGSTQITINKQSLSSSIMTTHRGCHVTRRLYSVRFVCCSGNLYRSSDSNIVALSVPTAYQNVFQATSLYLLLPHTQNHSSISPSNSLLYINSTRNLAHWCSPCYPDFESNSTGDDN